MFKKVQELEGQTVEVELKKDGDFWQWVSIASIAEDVSSKTTGPVSGNVSRVTGSNYETKEERAARQVLIVRQSSLTAALGTLAPGAKAALKPEEVLDLAQKYTDWVFNTPEDKSGFDTMTDDIPF